MKISQLKILMLSALLMLIGMVAIPAMAAEVGDTLAQDGLFYVVNDDAATVSLVKPKEASYSLNMAVIPTTVSAGDGTTLVVTRIADDAFAQCDSLAGLMLPVTIVEIGKAAFAGCNQLQGAIVLPEGLERVGERAFYGCASLDALSLPSTLQYIGNDAFAGCNGVTMVFSHVSNPTTVVNALPDITQLWVDEELIDDYQQVFHCTLHPLIDVDRDGSGYSPCDVNRDGIINAADVTMVYNKILGYSDADGCDVNRDSTVNVADVTMIYNSILYSSGYNFGDKGYSFVVCSDTTSMSLSSLVVDNMPLSVNASVVVVAHDNENDTIITHDVGILKNALPSGEVVQCSSGAQAVLIDNKRFNQGTVTPVTFHFTTDNGDTYYKNVNINLRRHVVTDTLRVLSIGNSFSLDALSYMPFIMNAVAPEVYLKLGVMYIGFGGLDSFYNALGDDTYAPIPDFISQTYRYYWSYGSEPWTRVRYKEMREVLAEEKWDVVLLQQNSDSARNYATYQPYLNAMIEWLDNNIAYPHEYAWLITPSYPDNLDRLAPDTTSVQMFERIINCVHNVQRDTGIELLLPCGTAIQNARTTPLDSLGDLGHLFNHLHLQEGIPCMVESYAATAALLARYGLSDRVWTDTTWVDSWWIDFRNIPETNGEPVGMSEENREIAKRCARAAIENPFSITQIEY